MTLLCSQGWESLDSGLPPSALRVPKLISGVERGQVHCQPLPSSLSHMVWDGQEGGGSGSEQVARTRQKLSKSWVLSYPGWSPNPSLLTYLLRACSVRDLGLEDTRNFLKKPNTVQVGSTGTLQPHQNSHCSETSTHYHHSFGPLPVLSSQTVTFFDANCFLPWDWVLLLFEG